MASSLRGRFVGTLSLNPFAPPFSPASSGAAGAQRVSLADSEASSDSESPSLPPQGRGKRVVEPRKRHSRRRRRRPPATAAVGGFLADACRSHPQPSSPQHSPPRRHLASVMVHPARPTGPLDADGYYQVQSCRRWRRRAPPKLTKPVPKNLVGLCFNCLAGDPIKADCVWKAKCFICKQPGHEARDCRLQLRQGAVSVAARRPATTPVAMLLRDRVRPTVRPRLRRTVMT